MVTLRKHPLYLFINWSIPVLFTVSGLLSTTLFSSAWWGIIALALAICVLLFFWPDNPRYVYPYLIAQAVLILSLTALNLDFMFLGFTMSAHAAILLPSRSVFILIGAFWLGLRALISYQFGWAEDLLGSLALLLGFCGIATAYGERERAEAARRETQRLLDDLREAHQKLETYAVQAQEMAAVAERNRIARELHDTVKQQAFAVSGQLGAARSLLAGDQTAGDSQRAAEHLRTAETLMDEIRAELGQLIHALGPAALEDQGLAPALRSWCRGWSEQSGIAIDVRVLGDQRALDNHQALETQRALFRIVQEALSNVARHSQASRAEVCLSCADGQVVLTISDNGQGFHPPDPHRAGIGLRSMRERADRLNGGAIKIESEPGKGTRVEVHCDI